jgi:hypothetical protein
MYLVSTKFVNGQMKLKYFFKEIGCEDVGWIHLAQNRNQRRVILHTITLVNSRVAYEGEVVLVLN